MLTNLTTFRAPGLNCNKNERHTGVLDMYRYTLARRYAGHQSIIYTGVRVTSKI